MIQVGRRIFFDNKTGSILYEINEQIHYGNRLEQTVARDIESITALSERNRETFDVIELPYGAYAQDFREGRLIGVDLETKIPIFEYPNPEEPSEPIVPEKPLSVEIEDMRLEMALNTVETFELMNNLNEQQKIEQAQSNAELFEMMLTLTGGAA